MNGRSPRTFRIAARFHPGFSLLGRFVGRLAADRWQAGALYLAVLTLGGTALVLGHIFAWNLAQEAPTRSLSWITGEAAVVLVAAAISLIGWQPAITVTCNEAGLRLRQGRRQLTVAPGHVTSIAVIPARRYHRHERRYVGTRAFVNRVPEEVLLVRTAETVVAIGLAEPDRLALRRRLEARCLSSDRGGASTHEAATEELPAVG